jgi:DNA repair protein RadD
MRVDYYDGLLCVASEWVCFEHGGFARQKAEQWWLKLLNTRAELIEVPQTVASALKLIEAIKNVHAKQGFVGFKEPTRIATRKNGKYTEVKEYEFHRTERHQDAFEEATQGH